MTLIASHPDYQTYIHGSADDFDRHTLPTGDHWNNNKQKYIQKARSLLVVFSLSLARVQVINNTHVSIDEQNEKPIAPADYQFTPFVHGFHGAVDASLPGFPTPLDTRVIASAQETTEFPFNQDMNSGDVLGIGAYIQYSTLLAITIPLTCLIFYYLA